MKKRTKIIIGVVLGIGLIGSLADGEDTKVPDSTTSGGAVTVAQAVTQPVSTQVSVTVPQETKPPVTAPPATTAPATQPSATAPPATNPPTTKAPTTSAPDGDALVEVVVLMLEENMGDTVRVRANEEYKIYELIPRNDDILNGAMLAVATGDTDDWDMMTDSLAELSNSLADITPDWSLALVNSANTENYIFVAKNGRTISDSVHD